MNAPPNREQLAETAAYLTSVQLPSGAIPWEPGAHIDAWDHLEVAMALNCLGEYAAADAAYEWLRNTQRANGTWPIRQTAIAIQDAGADTNQCAYLGVALWHHWLIRHDLDFVADTWPALRRALDFVAGCQLDFGGISWAVDSRGNRWPNALVASSASIWHAFECGVRVAELLGEPVDWAPVARRLRTALTERESDFDDNSRYAMDWYYPVLTGVLTGSAARTRLGRRWEEFVVPGLGVHCVTDRPWVTGAETCELAIAMEALGDREIATRLVGDMQHLREHGEYHTGLVYADGKRWPIERSTWTAAAMVLALDAVTDRTPGAAVFRGAHRGRTIKSS